MAASICYSCCRIFYNIDHEIHVFNLLKSQTFEKYLNAKFLKNKIHNYYGMILAQVSRKEEFRKCWCG